MIDFRSQSFNAQTAAHALLRQVSTPADGHLLPGIRNPNKRAAIARLQALALEQGIAHAARRVRLVTDWIRMCSGVRISRPCASREHIQDLDNPGRCLWCGDEIEGHCPDCGMPLGTLLTPGAPSRLVCVRCEPTAAPMST